MRTSTQPLYEPGEAGNPTGKRTSTDTVNERDSKNLGIKAWAGSKTHLTMRWDLSPEAIDAQLVEVIIGKEHVVVNKDQILKALRWV